MIGAAKRGLETIICSRLKGGVKVLKGEIHIIDIALGCYLGIAFLTIAALVRYYFSSTSSEEGARRAGRFAIGIILSMIAVLTALLILASLKNPRLPSR